MSNDYGNFFTNNDPTAGLNWGGMQDDFAMANSPGSQMFSGSSPLSYQASMPMTPGFSMDLGQYSAPMKDAFSYAGNQMKEGNVMGGLGDLANWGKDKVSNSGVGQATKNWWGGMDNADKFGTVMGGIQTAANIYGGYKQLSLANDQFEAQKDMWNKSWAANKKNVNENVQYRAQARHNTNPGKADEDIKKYSL